jgi:succinoglycan biosynthesis protein ExoM
MNNICICVPTYKRTDLLEKLLTSIVSMDIDKDLINSVSVIIVDNDIEKSAEEVTKIFKHSASEVLSIFYFNYPKKGLANVRNELMRRALELKPDYIACVDDDEYVSKEWLNNLTHTIITNNADIAMGPVLAYFSQPVPSYISYHFRSKDLPEGQILDFLETNNFIISSAFLQQHNLKFDSRFNLTGGEDSYFGIQALKNNAKIIWSRNAEVYESIPDSRANLKWLLKRKFRTSNCFTYILILEKDYTGIAYKITKSFFYLIFGIPLLFLYLFPFRPKYKGLIKMTEALGGLSAFMQVKYYEYKGEVVN